MLMIFTVIGIIIVVMGALLFIKKQLYKCPKCASTDVNEVNRYYHIRTVNGIDYKDSEVTIEFVCYECNCIFPVIVHDEDLH